VPTENVLKLLTAQFTLPFGKHAILVTTLDVSEHDKHKNKHFSLRRPVFPLKSYSHDVDFIEVKA
jgi:hypothetical protein